MLMLIINIIILLFAPFLMLGVVKKTKAFWSGRKGVCVLQPLWDFWRLMNKDAVYSKTTSWVFKFAPIAGFASILFAPSTVVRVANECPNIVGYKAASGNLAQVKELIAKKPPHFDVFSGDDGLTVDIMEAGGVGVISVFGNAFPKQMTKLVTAMQEGRVGDARNIHGSLNELFQLIFVDGNPSGIKALMEILGMLENNLRLPLVPACDDTYSDLQQAITFLA